MFSINISEFYLELFISFACFGFISSYLALETIYTLSKHKNLVAKPEVRSSHSIVTPTLGGIAIYMSELMTIMLIGVYFDAKTMLMFLSSTTVLMFLGLKDDLLFLSQRKKFIIQVCVGLFFILITDIRITHLFGLFDIQLLSYEHSIAFSTFVLVLILNAYNIIDGIDGLAAGFGIVSISIFSILHYLNNQYGFALIGASFIGSLVAFSRLNLSEKRKMFMGDTGSMVIGFSIAVFAINFLKISSVNNDGLFSESAPVIVLSLLFFPLMDTLRVIVLRVFKYKTSPFKADKNHVHHYFLKYLRSHVKVSLLIICINILIIFSAFIFKFDFWEYHLLLISLLGILLYFITFQIIKRSPK